MTRNFDNVHFDARNFEELYGYNLKSHYFEDVFNCVVDEMKENYGTSDNLPASWLSVVELCWDLDSVTGGGSGSFYMRGADVARNDIFNTWNDESYALLAELLRSRYGAKEGGAILVDHLARNDFEGLDVIIRQLLLDDICEYIYKQLGIEVA